MRAALATTVLGISMAYSASVGAQVSMPTKVAAGDYQYYTNLSQCEQLIDMVHSSAQEAAKLSVGFQDIGTHDSYDQDGANTIGCSYESPFMGQPIASEEGIVSTDWHVLDSESSQIKGTARVWVYRSSGVIAEWDIWLNTRWVHYQPEQTIKHELGHALGLPHSEFVESIMFAANGGLDWDIETIAKLSFLYGKCDPIYDYKHNLLIPKIVGSDGEYIYLIMPAGTVWPSGVKLELTGPSYCADN